MRSRPPEEAVAHPLLVHVLDCNNPDFEAHAVTTEQVLKELGAGKTTPTVFNKIDSLEDRGQLDELRLRYPEASFVSALTGEGLPDLFNRFEAVLQDGFDRLRLPHPP